MYKKLNLKIVVQKNKKELKKIRGLVFINKTNEIIKLFESCTREEIGIALFAYEQFLCKGLKVSDKDLERLTEIFNYYDEELSDDFPSLTNDILQNADNLISEYFNDRKTISKDNYKVNANLIGNYDGLTHFEIAILENKTGCLYNNFGLAVKDKSIKADYGKDSFNAIYNACEEVNKKVQDLDIKLITCSLKK